MGFKGAIPCPDVLTSHQDIQCLNHGFEYPGAHFSLVAAFKTSYTVYLSGSAVGELRGFINRGHVLYALSMLEIPLNI